MFYSEQSLSLTVERISIKFTRRIFEYQFEFIAISSASGF